MNSNHRLHDAIYHIKFGQLPGTHFNGSARRELTVEQALDQLALLMGMKPVTVKPLYEIDWNARTITSNVSGHKYWVDELKGSGEYTVKYYGTWHGPWATINEAIDFLADREREDAFEYAY